jgi:hypothetical protein
MKIKQTNMDKQLKVIHLYVKETNKHYYFGSLSSIYYHFDTEQIGITHASLKTRRLKQLGFYENKKVIIRQGFLLTKPQKVKELEVKASETNTEVN